MPSPLFVVRAGPVHELTGRAITSSSISVKWRYPRLPNGDVTMYRLSVSLSDQQLFLEVTFKVKPVNCAELLMSNVGIKKPNWF